MKRFCFPVMIFLIMFCSLAVYGADNTTITDINHWDHPVKAIFTGYGIRLTKVELINNKTYPIFYCNFPGSSGLQEKETFEKMVKDTLKANGYWSYKLVCNLFEVEVKGNPKDKQYIEVSYQNIDKYFKQFAKADNLKINYEQAKRIMIKQFGPEAHKTGLIEEGHYEVTIVNFIDSIVEYNNKYYYSVHSLESHYDHSATLGWALIDADDGGVYYDHQEGVAVPADKIRKPIEMIGLDDGTTYKMLSSSLSSPVNYLWQYHKKNKELQKVDLNTLKIVRSIKLSETFIQGDILSFTEFNDQEKNASPSTLVVAAREKGKYAIYKSMTENDRFRWCLDPTKKPAFKELQEVLYFKRDNVYILSMNGGDIQIEFSNNSQDGWSDLSKPGYGAAEESEPLTAESLYKNFYIGEVLSSGYIYIEPFAVDRKPGNKPIVFSGYPKQIKFYPFEGDPQAKFYEASFDSVFKTNVPSIEEESRYFLEELSQLQQFGLRYKTKSPPQETKMGITFFGTELSKIDYQVNGEKRPYSNLEYQRIRSELLKDPDAVKVKVGTTQKVNMDDTMVAAEQILVGYFSDRRFSMRLSLYFTHTSKYAAKVYVLDILKDNQVIKTYEKHNWDGPY